MGLFEFLAPGFGLRLVSGADAHGPFEHVFLLIDQKKGGAVKPAVAFQSLPNQNNAEQLFEFHRGQHGMGDVVEERKLLHHVFLLLGQSSVRWRIMACSIAMAICAPRVERRFSSSSSKIFSAWSSF